MRGLFAIALAMSLVTLAGCGQKGPLYLPDQGPFGNTQAPPQSAPASESPDTHDNNK